MESGRLGPIGGGVNELELFSISLRHALSCMSSSFICQLPQRISCKISHFSSGSCRVVSAQESEEGTIKAFQVRIHTRRRLPVGVHVIRLLTTRTTQTRNDRKPRRLRDVMVASAESGMRRLGALISTEREKNGRSWSCRVRSRSCKWQTGNWRILQRFFSFSTP